MIWIDRISKIIAVVSVVHIIGGHRAGHEGEKRVSKSVGIGVRIPCGCIDGRVFVGERVAIVVHSIADFVRIRVVGRPRLGVVVAVLTVFGIPCGQCAGFDASEEVAPGTFMMDGDGFAMETPLMPVTREKSVRIGRPLSR